jgi:hypothetical protein
VFKFRKEEESTDLQEEITALIEAMSDQDRTSEEYATMATVVKTLMEAHAVETTANKPNFPSADTMLSVGGSLVGILLIMSFEKANVITTKSLNFIPKFKI